MPVNSTTPAIKTGLEHMRELHNTVSSLQTGISKTHFWTEMLEHISGAGHLAIFGLAEGAAVTPSADEIKNKKGDLAKHAYKSATDKFGVLFGKTKSLIANQTKVLSAADDAAAITAIKGYLNKAIAAVDAWETSTWKAGYLPDALDKQIKAAKAWIKAN